MTEKVSADKGSNQPSVKELPKKGSVEYKQLVTEKEGGEVFIRRLKVIRYVYQRCRWTYQNGKRKLQILKTLNRKPRGI